MERLTYEHDGRWCIDGKQTVSDTQANCWGSAADRLAAYENTGLTPEQIQEAVDLLNDSFYDADIPKELLSWVERCTWHVRKCNELHTELEKYRALGSLEDLTEMKFRLEGLEK